MRAPRLSSLLIALFLLIIPVNAVQIVEFCPDPYLSEDPDEYIVLEGNGLLDGITVSDGEGGFRFPAGCTISGRITIAKNAIAFCQTHARYPDYEWYDYSKSVPDVVRGGTLALGNSRDELYLYDHNQLIQSVAWPTNVTPREGQIHYLTHGIWDIRPLFIGQSRFIPEAFDNVTLTVFVSPDSSYEILTDAIEGAQREIHLNVYEFSSPGITQALIDATGRGVSVTVLLEGGPVGGMSSEEKAALYRLNASGIPVYQMQSTLGSHAPYRYDHAKYLVIDENSVLVTSENFKASGIPNPGTSGNRGWGVYIRDEQVARYMDMVFETDVGSRFIAPARVVEGTLESPSGASYPSRFSAETFSGARVTPVLAPDTCSLVLDLMNSATRSIDIEQAYITNKSPTELNPYLATAINASRNGVSVRVLLDSYWYNLEDTADNDEMVRMINRIAQEEHLPLEARLVDTASTGFEKIHNKGVIVDNERVLISSINWNTNSPNFNREVGVIIDHPGVARYFSEVFLYDWNAKKPSGGETDYLKVGIAIAILAGLALIALRRYRH
ncbi:MAG: phospholipase D-like domain-containing protein [Methanoregulaceae archaeon]